MTHVILSKMTASITELKKHPMSTVRSAGGQSLAILSHNEPVFYCVPAKMYEAMMDALDDAHLAEIVRERAHEEEIAVSIDDL